MSYKRITKAQAKKLWFEGHTIYLCPCKMLPGGMWHVECPIGNYKEYSENANWYSPEGAFPNGTLWKGNTLDTAWDLMYNNWAYYNTNYEMGYYAHYYRKG